MLFLGYWTPAVQAASGTPVITQQPQGRSVLEGSNFSFSVTATGTAPFSYRWKFNGSEIATATNAQLAFTPVALSNAGLYQVVVSNSVGTATSVVAQLVVRSTNDPVYAAPDGGWTYIYAGNAIASSSTAGLDGTWNRVNGDDAWSGDGRGAGIGLPGGLSTSNGIVTIEDAVSPGSSGLDNRRYYFTHSINGDAGSMNANTLLNDGVTLSFRARLTPPSDPLIELTNAPNGFVNVNDGKGMFGIRQAGSSGMLISFSLNKAIEDTSTTTSFTNSAAGLHMNNLNGDTRSSFVDPGEGGTINLLALDPAQFHEFWIQIQDNGASAGTHRVSIYVDGSLTPTIFNVTAGSGIDTPFTNYLALGLPSSNQRGAVDVDFFGYKTGIVSPVGLEAPPGIVLQPVSRMLAEGEAASFTVGVTGSPPFQYQWFKGGTAIPNATNSFYVTPAVLPSDDGADFVAVVSNVNGSSASTSAILTVVPDTQPPGILSVGSFDGTRVGVCFTERVTETSATNLANYSINGGAVSLVGAVLRTNDGASVILTVSGLSSNTGSPFIVTASNIRDVSAASNSGGGSVAGVVLGLTPTDIGTPGVDPVAAGSEFGCSTNAFEVVAGGSDIGGVTDGFHFLYRARPGDFDIAMRVARLDATDRLSKAALIAREDLSAGSRNVNVFVTPASVQASDGSGLGTNIIEADYRAVAGASATEWAGGAKQSGVPYPNAWIRLVRIGDLFTSYQGTNGVDWTQLGQMTAVFPSTMYVGLGVTAHTNAAGRSTTALIEKFAFAPPPEITSQPQSLVVTNGDSAAFAVVANGVGTLSYQWRFSGTNITDATNSAYVIASAQPSNAGPYSVRISNAGGTTESATAILTVRVLDYGDLPDTYHTLRASNGARHVLAPGVYLGAGIDIELDGSPGPTALGDDSSGLDDEDGVRFLSTLFAGQTGNVEVVASTNGLLNAWIDWSGNGTFADAGEQIFTNRVLTTGTNVLQFIVSPQSTMQATYARFRFSTTGSLSFDGPAADGEVEDYSITVSPAADLGAIVNSSSFVAVGSNLTFNVAVTNRGPSTATIVNLTNQVTGLVNFGTIISSRGACSRIGNTISCALGQMLSGETASIEITLTPQASGTISNYVQVLAPEMDPVTPNNSFSSVVLVELAPAITAQPISQTITQSSGTTFTVSASGTAPLFYQWRKNSAPISGQQQTTLAVTNAGASDDADYSVQVSNRVGSVVSQAAHLTVLLRPTITQEPQGATNYAGGSVPLSVGVGGTAPFRYQWFFNTNTVLANATNASLLLTNTLKTQSGDYHVIVSNSVGVVTSKFARILLREADFGDAPDSYGTTVASNGARHLLVAGIRLGAGIDYESNGLPHVSALGDDLLGVGDEDGVVFGGNLYLGQPATLAVRASTNGVLSAWMDFQTNGTWIDPVDQIFTNVSLLPGTNSLLLIIPTNAVTSATFARFRFSTAANLTPFGEALDGEVEDYLVTINPASDLRLAAIPGPAAIAVANNITNIVRLTNSGPSSAHSIVLTNILPLNAAFVSATSSEAACSQAGGIVTCTLASLEIGQTATVTVVVHPFSAGFYTNTTTLVASEFDPFPTNNTLNTVAIVQQPPAITVQPASQTVTNGDTIALSVGASGTALQYQWSFSGTNLSFGTNASLILTNIQPSQAGDYTVKVSNLVGEVVSSPASLTVIVAPTVVSQPHSTSVILGGPASFSVTASGTSPLSYLWYLNGVPLPTQTASNINIASAQSSDAGDYVVRIQNNAGMVFSDPATLTVIIPPAISQQPQSGTYLAGSDAVLTLQATGSLPLSYQWRFNNNPIAVTTNGSLVISNIHQTNAGTYSVFITNVAGNVTSDPFVLTVVEMDFGDAPAIGYPTSLAFNGARHRIVPGVHLGAKIDYEADGQPNIDATGDDLSSGDEDGILFLSPWYLGQSNVIAVVASTNGFLDAWVDCDQNGSWLDVGEQIFGNRELVAGTNLLAFDVPATALSGSTFARFRFSTSGGLSAEGEALDGEVEDYRVTFYPAADLTLTLREWPNAVILGSNLIYTITVSNRGPSEATNVAALDPLPPGVAFVGVAAAQGGCVLSNAVVVCDLGTLALSQMVTVTLEVQPSATGSITNSAMVIAAQHDPNAADNVDTRITPVVTPAQLFANPDRIDVNDAGTALTYPSTIFVSGLTSTLFKAVVTLSNVTHSFPDDLDVLLVGPDGQSVMLISDSGGNALIDGITLRFDDDALLTLPDNSIFISGTYKPANFAPADDPFPPPAPAPPYGYRLSTFKGIDPNGLWSLFVVDDDTNDVGFIADGWSLELSTINPLADVALTVFDLPHEIIIGSNLTYSIVVTNKGPGWASQIHLRDVLPTNVDFVSVSTTGGSCSNSPGSMDCAWTEIAPLSSRIVTLLLHTRELGVISNFVAVTSHERDLNHTNNTASTVSECKLQTIPWAVVNPVSLVRVAGGSASFSVQAVGTMPIAYQWRHNGTNVPQATTSQLTISNLSLADGGMYDVQLTNPVGTNFSASAFLRVNFRPVIGSIVPQTTPEDTAKSVAIVIGDFETSAESLQLSASSSDSLLVPPSGISISGSGSNRFVNLLPGTNLFGSATIFVVVTDGDDLSATNSFTLTVSSVNDSPVISNAGPQVTDEDVAKDVNVTVGDVETVADSLGLSATSSNTNLVANTAFAFSGSGSNRVVTIRPTTNQFGTTTIRFIVTDLEGRSATNSFLLTVNSVNDAPVVDPIADQVTSEDAVKAVAIRIGDVESAAATLTLQATSTNAVLVPNENIVLSGTGSNRVATILPATNATGVTRIVLIATDPFGAASTNGFQLTVNPANDPPSISPIADVGINEDTSAVVNFAVFDLEDGTNVTVTGSSSDLGLVANTNIVISGVGTNRTATITPGTNQTGSTFITLTVRDPQLVTASTTFKLTVNAVNDAPLISAITNQVIAEDTSTATLPFVVTDLESAASNLVVTAHSSNQQLLPDANITLTSSNSDRTVRLAPATNQFGAATITLTVRDPDGLAATNSFQLTVTAVDDAPSLSPIANQTIAEDTLLSLPLTLIDIDTPASNLVLSATSSNLVLVPNGSISFTGTNWVRNLQVVPATNASGTAAINVRLSDGFIAVTQSFVLTVMAANDAPTLNPINNLVISENASLQTINLTGISSGAADENQTLSVTATSSNPALIPPPNVAYTSPNATGSLSFTPVANARGSAIVKVTVDDGQASLSRSFNVTVNASNRAPTISAIANQSVAEDTNGLAVAFVVNDADTPAFLLSVTANSSNTTLVPVTNIVIHGSGTNRTAVITPAPNGFGTTLIGLTVSDGQTNASSSFLLTVNSVNDRPTLNPLDDQNFTAPGGNGTINQTINLTGITSGALNETQTLTITAVSSNTAVFNNPTVSYASPNSSGTLQLTSVRSATGSAIIAVTVNDGQATNNTFTRTFTARLKASNNSDPTISTLTNTVVNEDQVAGPIPFVIGDAGTAVAQLIVTARSLNPLLIPDTNIVLSGTTSNRTLTATPLPNASGSATIQVTVTDNAFASVTSNLVVTVNAVNDAPTISSITNVTINEDAVSPPLAFSITDVETPANSLLLAASSSNPTLLPTNNVLFAGSGTNRAVVLTPAADQFGTSVVTIAVSDGLTNTSTSFVLTVNPIPDLPTIAAIPDQSTLENVPAFVPVIVGDGETPAGSLSLTATSSIPSLVASLNFTGATSNRTLTIVPATNRSGSASITVTVSDTDGGTTDTSFLLTVTASNDPPTLDPISDVLVNEDAGVQIINLTGITAGGGENQTLAVSAVSSNIDLIPNPIITYTTPNSTGSLSFTPIPGTNGAALISVTVNDGYSNTTTRSFTVRVNDRPSISPIADQAGLEDTVIGPISFTVGDRDTAASNLVLIATSSNPALIPDANISVVGTDSNRTVQLIPLTNQFGFATITLSASDSNNLAGSRSFSVLIAPVNDAPTLNPINNLTLNEDPGLQTVNLSGITTGASNEPQTLTISAVSSNPALVPNPTVTYTNPDTIGTLSFTPAANGTGTVTITVTVSDGGTLNTSATQSFNVTINEVNDAPTLDPIPDLAVSLNAGQQFIGLSGISAGVGEAQPLSITAVSSNALLLPNPIVSYISPSSSGYLTLTPAANRSGFATITVFVDDGGSNNNLFSRTFQVTVGTPAPNAPTIVGITRGVNGTSVMFTTQSSFRYTLESKDILAPGPWTPLGNVIGNGSTMTLTDPAVGATRFYHIRVE